ncbi:hypothetical protein SAMN05216225_100780 [Ornithinibacillus halophilus]|uniref:DUF4129 domain-containing protein n=2 Tax=Ornithinibacillus halophilus TaxID=930117 RepID=A0A1M5F6Z1_9BACI|nr:hypothetical protein SAMN05216225_100780 [Ornithinibacillus halophilus]
MVIDQESNYLLITIFLSVINLIVVKDSFVMVYLLLQTTTILIGYIAAHFFNIKRDDQKNFNHKLIPGLALSLLVGSGFFYWFANTPALLKIWDGFIFIVFRTVGLILSPLEFLDSLEFGKKRESEEEIVMTEPEFMEQSDRETLVESIPTSTIITGIAIFVIILVILFIIRLYRQGLKNTEEKEKVHVDIYDESINKTNQAESWISKLFNFRSKKPDHRVRQLVFQFERRAIKYDKGRHRFETLEDWLQRLGFKVNFEVYQKVRYGDLNVTQQEIETLEAELKEVEYKWGRES